MNFFTPLNFRESLIISFPMHKNSDSDGNDGDGAITFLTGTRSDEEKDKTAPSSNLLAAFTVAELVIFMAKYNEKLCKSLNIPQLGGSRAGIPSRVHLILESGAPLCAMLS